MLDTIPVPADSKFGAMVARRLNASRPIAPAGSLAMSGPTGTGFSAPPQNLRDRRGGGEAYRHWTFSCTEDPTTHERTGGWSNKVVQIGLALYNFDESTSMYTDETECQDGRYYLEVSYNTEGEQGVIGPKAEVKIMTETPQPDLQSGKCYFYLGTVEDGKLTYGTHCVPVVYFNL